MRAAQTHRQPSGVIDADRVASPRCGNASAEGGITRERVPAGTVDPRSGRPVSDGYANWTQHPDNPGAMEATE